MNQEKHECKTLGPLIIESGTNRVGAAGRGAYFIGSTNKDGVKNNISFHEGDGLARYYTEKGFQVECGIKSKQNTNNYKTIVHKGNYTLNADRGEIRLSGKTIIIEAADELHLLATNKIQIGYPEEGGTQQVLINAGVVDVKTKGGNMGDFLKTSSFLLAFATSYIPGGTILNAAKGMYGGATPGGFSPKSLAKAGLKTYANTVVPGVGGMAVDAIL